MHLNISKVKVLNEYFNFILMNEVKEKYHIKKVFCFLLFLLI